jgi:hypothetical protein
MVVVQSRPNQVTDPSDQIAEFLFKEARQRERRRRFLWSTTALLLLFGGLVVARGVTSSTSQRHGTRVSATTVRFLAPRCSVDHLNFTVTNTGNGAGSIVWVGTLVNEGSKICSLKGVPRLQMLGVGGQPITTTIREAVVSRSNPTTVNLRHHRSASFLLNVSDGAQSLPSLPSCPEATAILFTPGGSSRGIRADVSDFIAYPYDKGGSCGSLNVGAWVMGSVQQALCPACAKTLPKESADIRDSKPRLPS